MQFVKGLFCLLEMFEEQAIFIRSLASGVVVSYPEILAVPPPSDTVLVGANGVRLQRKGAKRARAP